MPKTESQKREEILDLIYSGRSKLAPVKAKRYLENAISLSNKRAKKCSDVFNEEFKR